MYEVQKKIRDPVLVLFMKIDERIENAMLIIIADRSVPGDDLERLISDKEYLLNIFKGKPGKSKEIQYDNVWSANNLINKIDYLLDLNNKL
jgi:hypothetical protein